MALAAALGAACSGPEKSNDCATPSCSRDVVCPPGLDATFESLRTRVFEASCETAGSCHSHEGAMDSGELDLETDPHLALLGLDGSGAPASNISGSVKGLRRVAPGDPDQSFLVLKLETRSPSDPRYGAGMPWTNPGSVCPATLAAVRSWIQAGAAPSASPEAGPR